MPTSHDHQSLDGRVIVVTGAGQGLGATTARLLAELGATVAAIDIEIDGVRRVTDQITEELGQALAIECDVSDEASVEAAAATVVKEFGRIDGLVNNAGIIRWGRLETLAVDDWDALVSVNLRGTFLCTKHFGGTMVEQESGSIVNISSVAGGAPQPNCGAYSPTKAAVAMLARQVAVEWGPLNIRTNSVSPGIMETPMADVFHRDPSSREKRISMIPNRRFSDPREVAAVIAWLIGDGSSFVNGQNIEVDGGMMQTFLSLLPRPGTPPVR